MSRAVLLWVLALCLCSAIAYDPDVDLTTPQIIRRHGYSVEAHTVLTGDGYLLTFHRITGSPHRTLSQDSSNLEEVPPTPRPAPQPVVRSPIFMQHGLLGSSADWIVSGPGKALAYLLADEGYDVWLGNARGNTYSRAHVNFSSCDSKFWDFTWHEMGYYDLPAAIDFILKETSSGSVIYIGHSMGTTMFYAMAASRPEYNAKVRAMYALAPVVYMTHVKSPIRLFAPFARDLEFIFRLLGENEFLPQNKILHLLAKYGCLLVATEKRICENIFFLLAGFDAPQFNATLLPVVLSHTPAGTSTKTVLHYAQEIHSGKFRRYDFGSSENYRIYNQSEPPEYDLSQITVPIEIHYAKNDWLAYVKDVEDFYMKLKNGMGKYIVGFPEFNHLDFLFGKDAKSQVYDPVIKHIKSLPPLTTSDEEVNNISDENRVLKLSEADQIERMNFALKSKLHELNNECRQTQQEISSEGILKETKIRSQKIPKELYDTEKITGTWKETKIPNEGIFERLKKKFDEKTNAFLKHFKNDENNS